MKKEIYSHHCISANCNLGGALITELEGERIYICSNHFMEMEARLK